MTFHRARLSCVALCGRHAAFTVPGGFPNKGNNTQQTKGKMKINTTVELTQEDLLQAITDYAKREYRWSNDTIAGGEALSVSNQPNGTVLVMWGKREEPKPETATESLGEFREPHSAEEFAAQIILGEMTPKAS